jgi:hypothetical protein
MPKNEYKYLWSAFHKIKIYRNNHDHLHLNNQTTEYLMEYILNDLEGKSFSQVMDAYFVLQQRVLDQLLLAILKEIDTIS